MIKQYSWKHLAIACGLTIVLCVGIFLFNQWDVLRFKKSLGEYPDQNSQTQQTEKRKPDNPPQQESTLTSSETDETVDKSTQQESNTENRESELSDNQDEDAKDANFYDLLDFLDELDEEEFAKLIESLDLEEEEKKALAELAEPDSETTEDVHPSSMIVDLMESGVASLAGLIELIEETTILMPEAMQERYSNTLGTLREMQDNGGGLIFHRPPDNPDGWMLMWINPSPSQRGQGPSISDDNVIHEIPSHDPNKESLFLHKGNSIIID
ncbi:hypothetical protein F4083_10190 [Candidatus Poribacteria bacterium]|nr:hypothetical protein [Candidatus Poribacteria bacterium]MYF56287.1 hypothetical protein [Candidatus Poribacteria bacterium]MYI94671.1 hypothetical protein [Candidatus Poribacteria bacterium]